MVELYDYSVDPEETTNLIDQSNYSEIAHELSTFLDGGDGWKLYAAAPSEKPAYLLNVSGNNGGSVSGGGNYEHGISAPITATPNQGYNFDGWTGDGILEINNSSTTVSMIEVRSAVASFSLKHFPLSVTAGVGGSIEGEGIFSYGSNPTIRAIPENGYSFVEWIGEGLENPLSSVTTVSMFEERDFGEVCGKSIQSIDYFRFGRNRPRGRKIPVWFLCYDISYSQYRVFICTMGGKWYYR